MNIRKAAKKFPPQKSGEGDKGDKGVIKDIYISKKNMT